MTFSWIRFHNEVKKKYLSIAPALWWGDDLDVRFFLLKNLIDLRNKRILDIGCNIGITLSFLDKSNELIGVDIDEFCVIEAQKLNPDAKIIKASMDYLPLPNNYFDVIIMMSVLPYYDFKVLNKEEFISRTFNEAKRVLKDNGILYLITPNGGSLHYQNSIKVKHEELYNYLNRAGLDYIIKGWNIIKPILPTFLANKVRRKYKFIPAKVLCHFQYVWKHLVNTMNTDVEKAKYFYIEIQKKCIGESNK